MFQNKEDVTLASRLKGVEDSQDRARLAFFILVYATGATLFGLWNMYLSWERQWAHIESLPKSWGQQQVLMQQIKSWIEGQSIGISLLGLRVSVSDINVLGSFVLFIMSLYYCMCSRRENHEIGSLLTDSQRDDAQIRGHVLTSIKSGMVLNPMSQNDTPYSNLTGNRIEKKILLTRQTQTVLTFLPIIAIAFGLLSDLYFSLFYRSPWRENTGPAWEALEIGYRRQLILMDVFGIFMGIGTFIFCKNAYNYNRATSSVVCHYLNIKEEQ